MSKVSQKFDKQNKEVMFKARISRLRTGAGCRQDGDKLDPSDSGQAHETPRFSPEGPRVGLANAASRMVTSFLFTLLQTNHCPSLALTFLCS